jgi:nucleolar protein 12
MRVTRAKNPQKTAQAIKKRGIMSSSAPAAPGSAKHKPKITPEQQSMAGRASRLLGVSGAARQVRGKHGARAPRSGLSGDIKTPEQIVFEGKRASSGDNMNLGKKQKGKKGAGKKPTGKRAKRASDWKKGPPKKSD